jgi:hypothetical protein
MSHLEISLSVRRPPRNIFVTLSQPHDRLRTPTLTHGFRVVLNALKALNVQSISCPSDEDYNVNNKTLAHLESLHAFVYIAKRSIPQDEIELNLEVYPTISTMY